MQNNSNKIIPVKTPGGLFIFEEKIVREYWETSLPSVLKDDETIRVVRQIKEKDGTYGKWGILTEKQPFRCPDDLMNYLNNLQIQNPDKEVGISISTAVFEYTGDTPKTDTFKYTNTIAIDIDTHINNTKERYVLGNLSDDQLKFAVINAWVEMAGAMNSSGIDITVPKKTYLTGAGLQFIIEFDRQLSKYEAQKIFGLFKNTIGTLKWQTPLGDAITGSYISVEHDIDKSFADITHVQRCAGTINQKYGVLSKEIQVFNLNPEELNLLKLDLIAKIDSTSYSEEQKKTYADAVRAIFKNFEYFLKRARSKFPVEENMLTAKMQENRSYIRQSELQSVEYDLLRKIKESGIDITQLFAGDVRIGPKSGNLIKLYCPFHEESNPSMALYINELFDVFKDFHDNKTYSLITFWEKLYNVSKSTAITQISEKAGIKLAKGERKDFQNLELAELVEVLIDKIDTENFVYYRLASKNRTCVVRHIDTGESWIFDGPVMLATHILKNQLNVYDGGPKLLEMFTEVFKDKILIDAFESFEPGKPTVFSKEFVKFVNLWVPSEKYKRVHIRAAELHEKNGGMYELDELRDILKRKTPWTYKYLLQMVQNGDLRWFLNWLVGVSHFKTMPTVPVFFGVQGAGKNLFVSTVMEFYLNNEYVKIVSGDRIMQQFNSMLESTSLLVLDEGDFSTGKEVDQLKLLTGNDKILIEKKGVDAVNKTRHFNVMFFSNGEVPLRHPAMDRRISYFRQDIPLLASCEAWNITVDEFVERVKSELVDFWAIIYNTTLDHRMAMANTKDPSFWRQILMQHPFGALIVKLMNNEWEDIALQLNENVQDPAEMKANLDLLATIQDQFNSSGRVNLTLINRYLNSLNFKMKQSIQKFIQINHLPEFGISIIVDDDAVRIKIDKKRVSTQLKTNNVLEKAYPKASKEEVSGLEADLIAEQVTTAVEADEIEAELKEIQENGNLPKPPPPPPKQATKRKIE